ncbi:MAG: hypothetical protein Q9162_003875 [Coniocarpon cinnabarinum]
MAVPSPLAPALASLRTSTELLSSSLSILDAGTRDLPRLSQVLQQTRHFELTPSSALASAQEDVLSELVPEVERLLERVERVIERREGREEWLRARWALGEGRLGRDSGPETSVAKPNRKKSVKDPKPGNEAKAARLRQKKERLSYSVERLTLQAQQRERQLRMSIAKQEASTKADEDLEVDQDEKTAE